MTSRTGVAPLVTAAAAALTCGGAPVSPGSAWCRAGSREWAELLVRGRWIPVDPSFEQAPAEGPRFTIGRWRDDDEAGRVAAGRSVLACWGRAAVEP